eukprot:5310122-Amphidinium_carterae.1
MTVQQWLLQSVAAWNARAVFHHDGSQASKKHSVLRQLMREHDITFACETHHPSSLHLSLFEDCGKGTRLHVSSGPSPHAGGILRTYSVVPGDWPC